MREMQATVRSKGRITIPAEFRRRLGILEADEVVFTIGQDGTVRLEARRYPNVASLRGAAGSLDRPLSGQEVLGVAHEDRLKVLYPKDGD